MTVVMARAKKPEKQAAAVVRKRPILSCTVSPEVRAKIDEQAEAEEKTVADVVDARLRIGFGMDCPAAPVEALPPDVEEDIVDRGRATGHDRLTTIAELVRLGFLYNRRMLETLDEGVKLATRPPPPGVPAEIGWHRREADARVLGSLRGKLDLPELEDGEAEGGYREVDVALHQHAATKYAEAAGGVACVLCGAPVPEFPVQRSCTKARSKGQTCMRFWAWIRPNKETEAYDVTKIAETMGGRACLVGTRMPVSTVISWHEQGGCAEVRQQYPHLTEEQIHVALAYAEAFPEEIAAELGHWPKHVEYPLCACERCQTLYGPNYRGHCMCDATGEDGRSFLDKVGTRIAEAPACCHATWKDGRWCHHPKCVHGDEKPPRPPLIVEVPTLLSLVRDQLPKHGAPSREDVVAEAQERLRRANADRLANESTDNGATHPAMIDAMRRKGLLKTADELAAIPVVHVTAGPHAQQEMAALRARGVLFTSDEPEQDGADRVGAVLDGEPASGARTLVLTEPLVYQTTTVDIDGEGKTTTTIDPRPVVDFVPDAGQQDFYAEEPFVERRVVDYDADPRRGRGEPPPEPKPDQRRRRGRRG